ATTTYVLTLEIKVLFARWTREVTTTVHVALPPVVQIKDNTPASRDLFIQAVDTPNTLVLLYDGVDMDLTGFGPIYIKSGVTVSSRACRGVHAPPDFGEPGGPSLGSALVGGDENTIGFCGVARDARYLGPRIYTRSRPKPLFLIQCNGENIF